MGQSPLKKNHPETIFSFMQWWIVAPTCVLLLGIILNPFSGGDEPIPPEVLAEEVTGFVPVGGDRSSHWPTVREEFAIEHPDCAACGTRECLNVHHVVPFHDEPKLELDPNNLITLCREHHFRIGHDPDGMAGPEKPNWKLSNPNVREEAAELRKKLVH